MKRFAAAKHIIDSMKQAIAVIILFALAALAAHGQSKCSTIPGVNEPGTVIVTATGNSVRIPTTTEDRYAVSSFTADVKMCQSFMVIRHTPEGRDIPVVTVIPSAMIQRATFEPTQK